MTKLTMISPKPPNTYLLSLVKLPYVICTESILISDSMTCENCYINEGKLLSISNRKEVYICCD